MSNISQLEYKSMLRFEKAKVDKLGSKVSLPRGLNKKLDELSKIRVEIIKLTRKHEEIADYIKLNCNHPVDYIIRYSRGLTDDYGSYDGELITYTCSFCNKELSEERRLLNV